jgi:hypothetical protein
VRLLGLRSARRGSGDVAGSADWRQARLWVHSASGAAVAAAAPLLAPCPGDLHARRVSGEAWPVRPLVLSSGRGGSGAVTCALPWRLARASPQRRGMACASTRPQGAVVAVGGAVPRALATAALSTTSRAFSPSGVSDKPYSAARSSLSKMCASTFTLSGHVVAPLAAPRPHHVALAVQLGHAVAGSGCVSCADGLESPRCGHSLHAKCPPRQLYTSFHGALSPGG